MLAAILKMTKHEISKSAKNQRFTAKDAILLTAMYLGILALLFILPENSPVIGTCILTGYALASYVAIDRKR